MTRKQEAQGRLKRSGWQLPAPPSDVFVNPICFHFCLLTATGGPAGLTFMSQSKRTGLVAHLSSTRPGIQGSCARWEGTVPF